MHASCSYAQPAHFVPGAGPPSPEVWETSLTCASRLMLMWHTTQWCDSASCSLVAENAWELQMLGLLDVQMRQMGARLLYCHSAYDLL